MKISLHSHGQQQASVISKVSAPPPFSEQPIEISGPERPWIPDGIYEGVLVGHRTLRYKFSHKVEFIFEVKVPGSDGIFTTQLGLFFEIAEAIPPLGLEGAFKPKGHRSKLAKLLSQCQETLETDQPLSMADLSKLRWEVYVSTVKIDWDGNQIPDRSRYSVIKSVQPIDPTALQDW